MIPLLELEKQSLRDAQRQGRPAYSSPSHHAFRESGILILREASTTTRVLSEDQISRRVGRGRDCSVMVGIVSEPAIVAVQSE